ncbi:FRG domain-containing protein [Capnocytophaga cynodegmi]|uniref:FRG domain-containing protein n=1 Tax=Capnocytophaga cynodegmi TaxID=28189 RepID=UPI00386C6E5B
MAKRQNKKLEKKGNKVTSIETYLSQIKTISVSENTFYRGHSDKNYKLEPSIYRKDSLIKNEHLIYRETISKLPYDFNGKSTIESLVLMQHYGVPTRILDLTTNALVALYFACVDNKSKDGEVIIFDISQEDTYYFDSDRVTILANLAKCDSEFYYTFGNLDKMETYKEKLSELKDKNKVYSYDKELEKKVDFESVINNLPNYFYINPNEIETLIKQFMKDRAGFSEKEKLSCIFILLDRLERKINSLIWEDRLYTNEVSFGKLLHHIRDDKSYFRPIINPKDVASVFVIKPKLDNPRIIRQQGAFLIFGTKEKASSLSANKVLKGDVNSIPQVPSEWIKTKIGIEANSKEEILEELSKLGIDKSTLFPEIEKVAEYIKSKYN